jgi:ElaA protein
LVYAFETNNKELTTNNRMMQLNWSCIFFDDLSNHDLYRILQLRSEVFVLEQTCLYQDMDGKDLNCWHLLGCDENGELLAYARLLPPGVSYDEPSIGRVLTSPGARRTGAGKELMAVALNKCKDLFGDHEIKIGAQLYLKMFYESFGFVISGPVYLEDGIEHIEMTREADI